MTDQDRKAYTGDLRATCAELFESIEGVSEDEAARRPEGGWSILDCVEHLAITERGMLRMITHASVSTEAEDRTEQEASILQYVSNLSRKAVAPASAAPNGRYPTLEQAAMRFREARERTIAFIEECPDDLRGRMLDHPFGRITARECLILITYHPRRHASQIRGLREAAASRS